MPRRGRSQVLFRPRRWPVVLLVALLIITGSLQQLLDEYARDLTDHRVAHAIPAQLTLIVATSGGVLTNY